MQMTRREFLGSAAVACLVPTVWGQSGKRDLMPPRIIYYNNFASHLLLKMTGQSKARNRFQDRYQRAGGR
jgi:hypothetical protein